MTMIILLLVSALLLFAVCAGAFLRIRFDIEELRQEKEKYIDLVQRFMESVVTHADMEKYLKQLLEENQKLSMMKSNLDKDRWKNLRTAFGGKQEDDD